MTTQNMTPYEAALIVSQCVGDGQPWPHHPSGLGPRVRAVLLDVAQGAVWRSSRGRYFVPGIFNPTPWMRAFKAAGLIQIVGIPAEDNSVTLGLTDLGKTVMDGTFIAKQPDLLDLLTGAAA